MKKYKRRTQSRASIIVFCVLSILFVSLTQAQSDRRFLQYGVVDGLSQNSVHCIYRDRSGLVWIGTQDGLNSFDGKNFTTYRHSDIDKQSISDQFVLNIKEDTQGFLWIGTRNGLNKLDKRSGKFTRYYSRPEEKHNFQASYEHYFLEADNKVYGQSIEPFILDPITKKVKFIKPPIQQPGNWMIAKGYKAWFITSTKCYFYNDARTGKYTVIPTKSFITAPQNELYFTYSDKYLIQYTSNTASEIKLTDLQSNMLVSEYEVPLRLNAIAADINSGGLHLSAADGLYLLSKNGKLEKVNNGTSSKNSLPAGSILCSYLDTEDNFWVGTAGSGFAVSNKNYNHYRMIASPADGSIVSAVTKQDNFLYVATRSGLYRMPITTKNNYKEENFKVVLPRKDISALTTDYYGNVWAASTSDGIFIINKAGKVIQNLSLKINAQYRTCLHLNAAQKDKIYISTIIGLFVANYDPYEKTYSMSKTALATSGTYNMHSYTEASGRLWVANNAGLDLFSSEGNRLLSYNSSTDTSSFLSRTIITTVEEGNDGSLWIGTIRSGVYRIKNKKISHFTTRSGLSGDVINNIVIDDKNRPWVSTTAGLNVLNDGGETFTTLSTAQGVPTASYSFSSGYKNAGKLYFGTSEGLLIINANEVKLKPEEVKAYVKDITVNGQSIVIKNNRLQLIPDGKLIVFELGATPTFSPRNVIYQYRLPGQNKKWISLPEKTSSISYTGLPYGNLTLEVRAANAESKLQDAYVYQLQIESRTPWYKALWFAVLVLMTILGFGAYLISRYNKRKYRLQLQELELAKELQTERNRIGRDLHDNMGAYTSAMIAGLNHIKVHDDEEEKQLLNLKDYGANIMGYLRETIWMLNTEKLSITAFADRIKNYSIRISNSYPAVELEVKEEIEVERNLSPTQMLNVFRIIQEALNNAYKHAGASQIKIFIGSKKFLKFSISDDGKGFDAVEKEDHYGLINMKDRAASSDFNLRIISDDGGTTISLEENTAYAAV